MFGRGHDRIISRRQIEQNQNVIFLKPSAPPSSQGRIRVGFDAFESTRSQDLARYRSRINDRFVVKPVQILLLLEGSSKGVRSFLSLGKKIIAIISSVFQDLEVFFRAEFIPISELKHELGHRCWSWTNGNLGQHRESRWSRILFIEYLRALLVLLSKLSTHESLAIGTFDEEKEEEEDSWHRVHTYAVRVVMLSFKRKVYRYFAGYRVLEARVKNA